MQYRPDIDGLRAIAVLAVLFFHFDFELFSGGFIGVDVFFVISGYLITSVILKQVRAGKFSLTEFYHRRAKRLFPALLAMIIFSTTFGYIIFLPEQFKGYCKSVLAAVSFLSNILFWRTSNYFAEAAERMPLLHTWSLAIEEQFYLFFPIFVLILFRLGKSGRAVTLGVLILGSASLITSLGATPVYPKASFFLIFARAWELMIGSILALNLIPRIRLKVVMEILGWSGVLLIIYSAIKLDETSVFPGYNALLPVLGAGLIIYSGEGNRGFLGRILSFRPVVFIGLISYSLYLWHWPVIVFGRQWLLFEWTENERIFLIFVSFVFAYLSWKFVESPFRYGVFSAFKMKSTYTLAGIVAFILCSFSLFAYMNYGLPTRFSDRVLEVVNASKDYSPHRGKCHAFDTKQIDYSEKCIIGDQNLPPKVLVWGDSHGVELAEALAQLAQENGKSIAQLTYSACPPIVGYESASSRGCFDHNRSVVSQIKTDSIIEIVVLVGKWEAYLKQDPYLVKKLNTTIDELGRVGKKVVLIYPIPKFPGPVPIALASTTFRSLKSSAFKVSYESYLSTNLEVILSLDSIDGPVLRIRPSEVLCKGGWCESQLQGVPLYFDDHHLSSFGARIVVNGEQVMWLRLLN